MEKPCTGLAEPLTRNGINLQSLNHAEPGQQDQESGSRTAIQEFYRDTNVFITGATGFLGKMLIEKLLRSCPDINGIYVMVRSKRGKKAEDRVYEMTNSVCFNRLKEEFPASLGKLHAVSGDISIEGLGICDEDCHLLAEKVNIVFHVAATVNFIQDLGSAIKMNVRGTRDMLVLSKTFNNLKSFVYISTAYAHCPSPRIKESFYPMTLECDEAIAMAERVSECDLDLATPDILGEWPNTYTFTKAIAENTVRQYGQGQGLPVGILRPSIVIWSQKEPVPGWVDNMYGASGIGAALFSGMFHTMQADVDKFSNMVPGDVVINALIAAAWDITTHWFPVSKVPIYHCVASAKKNIKWGTYSSEMLKHSRITPSINAFDYPYYVSSKHGSIVEVYKVFLHLLPAAVMDAATVVAGGKPRFLRICQKTHNFLYAVAWFTLREWHYEEKNLVNLWNILDSRDKDLFPFDMTSMDWEKFFQETFLGFRTHLMKEDPDTVPAARTRLKRLVWCKIVGLAVIMGVFGRMYSTGTYT